jgi:hypothetical protein
MLSTPLFLLGAGMLVAQTPAASPQVPSFDADVRPMLTETCQACHNSKVMSGGLDIAPLLNPGSLASHRAAWERIVARLHAGEMPPKSVARPPAEKLTSLMAYVEREFDRIDRAQPVNPGRVTARRLNRQEYANTVRDLLGVEIRPEDEFPPDDSGYGFDNIADVLTVSPALMQKYLSLAERIASRAVGGDPLPPAGFFSRRDRVRRLDAGAIELREIIERDAEYLVRVTVAGYRPNQDAPVTLAISVDGTTVKTASIPVGLSAVNRQGGATQRAVEEVRVFVPGNSHVFRAELVGDDGVNAVPENVRLNASRNIFPETIEIAGPYASSTVRPVTKSWLPCAPSSGTACMTRTMSAVARRAYRRPASREETNELVAVVTKARTAGYSPEQSLQFGIAAILVSPNFLFRIEREPKPGTATRIGDLELATRVSYFLWSSMPDEELLRLAESRRLGDPKVLRAQVARMIADPKSQALADNFAGQWLETRSLDAMKPDAAKFPTWGPELRDAMRTETRMFFEAVLRENRPISDFIDGKYTFLNERLAKHYGIDGVTGPAFRRVELTTTQRSGVFTQASVLTVSSYPTRTSPVLRGKYLLDNALNAPPPAPPAAVPALSEEGVGVAHTLRQQLEQHRADPVCASCHTRMDPLGFSLENYDAIGRWRTEEGKLPIDPTGELPNGRRFSGPADLRTILRENMPDFTRGLAEKLLTYSLGRGVEAFDRVTVRDLVRQTADQEYRLQALITGIVQSVPFQQRAGAKTN